jgi:esterase
MSSQAEALAHLRLASEIAGLGASDVVVPTDHHLVVDGLRLHCLDWGPPARHERPPLLFLHGGRLTAHTWDLVCLALRSRFRCVAVDLRGHGDSEWSPGLDYEPAAYVRDIRGVIEQLGLRRAVLIGHSLGGLHAVVYAADAAEELAGLVLVDVAPRVQWTGAQRIIDSGLNDPGPGSLEDFVQRALALNPRRDPRLLRYSLRHNLRRLPDRRWTWKYDPRRITAEHYASTKRHLTELADAAGAITCPVLVVRGTESDVLGDTQAADFAATFPTGRSAEVESAGHNIQGENPRGLIQVLTDFFAELEPVVGIVDVVSKGLASSPASVHEEEQPPPGGSSNELQR